MSKTIIHYEVTDTYGGEANYSWVKRGKIEGKHGESVSDLAAVRRVKKKIGWTGVECRAEHFIGGLIRISPVGKCQVCFINFSYEE